ncbi:MAG: TIGR03032 family protein [Planctomycetales bacterium]|nr:TIGR03032 family protein [Planctomycetales bacterium]
MNEHDSESHVSADRTVSFEHSTDFAGLLESLSQTLMITTYQAGKLVSIGAKDDQLDISFHNFKRPMGIAQSADKSSFSVASEDMIWHMQRADSIANQLEPKQKYDSCYFARSSSVTGDIQAHEMAYCGDRLWVVNTLFSCLCTLDHKHSFVPVWRPKFISQLAPEDRCHLNGVACVDGRPKYVTAMAQSDTAGGWREDKVNTGCLIDVDSGDAIVSGFAMPHSPRVHDGRIYLLDSGRGGLVQIDLNGQAETIARFPGYTRGLAIHNKIAFVGLSRIREKSAFVGVPIAVDRERLKCGVAVVDLNRRQLLGQFEFQEGVSEIFDVSLLPNPGIVSIHGPYAERDGSRPVWVVPEPRS